MKNKRGKVHPLTSPSPPSSSDALSVLRLLPAAFVSLIALLSLEDRQVLAYMLTRSLKSTDLIIPSPNFTAQSNNRKPQPCFDGHRGRKSPPLFDCDCFHCYTSFWFRWDSSPNRELIHQAIEAFEEHLSKGEQFRKGGDRKRDKLSRRKIKSAAVEPVVKRDSAVFAAPVIAAETEVPVIRKLEAEEGNNINNNHNNDNNKLAVVVAAAAGRSHKGLARKVLPDVMGIFSSRLWSLWSPKV